MPLNILELVFKREGNRELQKIKEAYNHVNLSYHYDVKKTPVIFLIAELLSGIIKPDEQDLKLFSFVEKSLMYFDASEKFSAFFSQFLVFLSYQLGVMAEPEMLNDALYYDFEQNKYLQYSPVTSLSLNKEQTAYVITLLRGYAYNQNVKLPHNERHDLIDKFLKYFTLRFGLKKLNSYELLRRML